MPLAQGEELPFAHLVLPNLINKDAAPTLVAERLSSVFNNGGAVYVDRLTRAAELEPTKEAYVAYATEQLDLAVDGAAVNNSLGAQRVGVASFDLRTKYWLKFLAVRHLRLASKRGCHTMSCHGNAWHGMAVGHHYSCRGGAAYAAAWPLLSLRPE